MLRNNIRLNRAITRPLQRFTPSVNRSTQNHPSLHNKPKIQHRSVSGIGHPFLYNQPQRVIAEVYVRGSREEIAKLKDEAFQAEQGRRSQKELDRVEKARLQREINHLENKIKEMLEDRTMSTKIDKE